MLHNIKIKLQLNILHLRHTFIVRIMQQLCYHVINGYLRVEHETRQ